MTTTILPADHWTCADTTRSASVGGSDFPERHPARTTRASSALGDQSSNQGHNPLDAQEVVALVGTDSATAAKQRSIPITPSRPSLFDPSLFTLARFLDDVEGLRKASQNRLRILTTTEPDEDGEIRGFGLDESHPIVGVLVGLSGELGRVEHETILALNKTMRHHPLAAWQKQAKGVGEKQLARLLASIGDPYLRTMPDGTEQPRTVSQLWAYAGLHTLPTSDQSCIDTQCPAVAGGATTSQAATRACSTPTNLASRPGDHTAAKRRKGVKANWSTDAKTRAYLIATSCIKQDGEYRHIYDNRRDHTATTHPDWTPGHSHNDALRIVSKRVLRDLWRASRDYHQGA